MTTEQAFQVALQHHQAGRLQEAEALYRQVLNAEPNRAEAVNGLGVIAYHVRRYDLAIDLLRRAILLNPRQYAAHFNLGEVCRAVRRFAEAEASYRRALELEPKAAEVCNSLGNALGDQGRWDEAVIAYRRASELQPGHAQASYNLGNALGSLGRPDEAIAAYRDALASKPDFELALNNLGAVLQTQGRLPEAIAEYRRAVELNPDYAAAYANMGNALQLLGKFEEALAAYRRAVALHPDSPEIYNSLGNALRDEGHFSEARAAYEQAIALHPKYADAYNNLGLTLGQLKQIDASMEAYRRALELQPDFPEACTNLGIALQDRADLVEARAVFRRALELKPGYAGAHSNLIIISQVHPLVDRLGLHAELRRWDQRHAQPLRKEIRPHRNDPDPARRLRVGYVSPDFRDSTVGRNLVPLFRGHDREQVEVFCYSQVRRPDDFTDDFRQGTHTWRDVVNVDDAALAAMIREDGVDVLVDLAMHTAWNRLLVFARQPAPVQVSFAAYPESTGLESIGWRISDRYLEGGREGTALAERVLLTESFWCFDPCGIAIEVNDLPAGQNGFLTFGCLNNFSKVGETVLRLWARILAMVPRSRLILLSPEGSHRQRVVQILDEAGVEAGRVEFFAHRPRRDYMELHHRVDVMLDPFPYNGHSTSLDALWMGVPVITLAGERPVFRGGLSELSNLGLEECVAFSEEEYVAIAARLAGDLPRLAAWRRELRGRMEASVLMDATRFARNLEGAYRTMWRSWCRSGR